MDWKTFSAEIFKALASLAWPAVLALGGWYYRDEVRALLRLRPTKLKAFGMEGEFEVPLQKAEALVDTSPTEPPILIAPQHLEGGSGSHAPETVTIPPTNDTHLSRAKGALRKRARWEDIAKLQYRDPTVAVIRAYGILRDQLIEKALLQGIPTDTPLVHKGIPIAVWVGTTELADRLGLPPEDIAAIGHLTRIKDEVSVGTDGISADEAHRFMRVVFQLISKLQGLRPSSEEKPTSTGESASG